MRNPLSFLVPELPEGREHYGALGRFADARSLYRACERVRDAGYTKWDAHTPFPVHGLERAMGLRSSPLPFVVLATGLGGAATGMLLQWWVHTQAYPLNFSGKPTFSWPAFVPVTFELGVLGAALGAVFGMFALNKLPMLHHPLFTSERFERASDDGLFISIESWDPKFDAQGTTAFLSEIGALEVELIAAS
ncbi:MAG TPA: DUF3341 domain-containing protein [Thermoanaerobaculia bacterium]|nr:DUF3341 domain-containing protein [Thermoanaerobaculia bacterium]